ncbi:SDR family NAD(P)-dependent oxidoreductase, partial [Streptomyces sp. NPDC088251]
RPDWNAYYSNENRHRIPLPTHPLNRKHHWLDKYVPKPTVPEAPSPHPLLDRLLVRSMGQSVFLTEFALDRHWVLSEHKLLGEAIVPGTTYLEMACAAAVLHFGQAVTELRDITFLVPLLVQENAPRAVHTTVRESSRGVAEFTVASHDQRSDSWTIHAQGTVGTLPHTAPAPRQNPAELWARCGTESVDVRVRQAEHKAMEFGRRWLDSLHTVHVGVRAALGPLGLPERFWPEARGYTLHPALLDLATGFGGFAVLETEDDRRRAREDRGFFLPVGYDSLRIHGPIPVRALSFIEPQDGFDSSDEVRRVDVTICDEAGATAVEIRGFSVKRVTDAGRTVAQLRPHARHHTLRWKPSGTAPTVEAAAGDRIPPARVLLVGEPGSIGAGVSAALRDRGVRVTEAVLADAWEAKGTDRYDVPPTAEGFGQLLDALGGDLPDEVVHVAAPVPVGGAEAPGDLNTLLGTGVYALFTLVRALSGQGAVPTRFSVVAPSVARVTGQEESTAPVHATLFGLAKVVGQENQGTDVFCLDIAGDTSPDAVCAELLGQRAPAAVALRQGNRYVAELVPADLPQRDRSPQIRSGGVYLIAGGLGGLGIAVARHLSRTVPGVRLALVNRTALPPLERWDEVPDTDSKRQGQIAALRELRMNGADVRSYQGDVTSHTQMADVVGRIRDEMGSIGCVVHGAGVAGDGFLFRKDLLTFRRTLEPKVLGAAVLQAVTQEDPPDLVVNFGSTVSVFGAAGQGDYTAANAYLDHFAEERSARGLPTVTVGWSDWTETGMAFEHGVQRDQGFFRSLSTEEGLRSFDEVVAAQCGPAVIVGEINYPLLGRADGEGPIQLVKDGPLVLSASVERAVAAAHDSVRQAKPAPAEPPSPSVRDRAELTLLGREDGEYSATERALAGVWAKELGLSEVNVHDSSFALGVDSLSALRLAQKIQKVMEIRVSMVDMYQYDTVAEFAEHLDSGNAPA